MILDTLDQLSRYQIPHARDIITFMASQNPMDVADGEHEILGRELFVRVMSYEPKPAHENRFEAHRVHADVQLVVQGVELMQVAPLDQLKPLTEYDAKGDCQFFSASGFWTDLTVRANTFAIFFPGEAHRPACLYQDHRARVKKFVFKIKMQ